MELLSYKRKSDAIIAMSDKNIDYTIIRKDNGKDAMINFIIQSNMHEDTLNIHGYPELIIFDDGILYTCYSKVNIT